MNTICIMCPMGCPLEIEQTQEGILVKGCTCKRGKIYGEQEFTAPKRMVTSLVEADNGRVLSVKTSDVVDKDRIFDVLDELKAIKVCAPIKIGDIIIKDVCGSGVDIVATASME